MSEPTNSAVETEGAVEAEAKEAWQTEVERRLKALERDILGDEPNRRKLTKLLDEVQMLACVVAWHREQGNITSAAERRGTSRRVLRERVNAWEKEYPQYVPLRPPRPQRHHLLSEEEEEKRARTRARRNARQRAARAKARAEKAARAGHGGVEPQGAKAAARP